MAYLFCQSRILDLPSTAKTITSNVFLGHPGHPGQSLLLRTPPPLPRISEICLLRAVLISPIPRRRSRQTDSCRSEHPSPHSQRHFMASPTPVRSSTRLLPFVADCYAMS